MIARLSESSRKARITYANAPNAIYSLCVYYHTGRDGSIDYTRCSTSAIGSVIIVEIPEVETGGDDSGWFYISVERLSGVSCAKYALGYNW